MMDPVEDETQISEITIQPDGRVYVFGTSHGLLEVLRELSPEDAHLNELLRHVGASNPVLKKDVCLPQAGV